MWGQNVEQTWVEEAWSQGYGSAYRRMLEEATALGAHGVIGVTDRCQPTWPTRGTTEFHFLGTAVKVEDGPSPAGGVPWTTYLAGQRLTKSIEAGFMPVAVVAAMASVRVWAYCMTEYLMEGSRGWGWPDRPLRRAGEQGAHGGAAAGPQARAPAAGSGTAARRPDRRGQRGSCRRATRSSTAPCGATACDASRTSTRAAAATHGAAHMSEPEPELHRTPGRDAERGAVAGRPGTPSQARGVTSDLSIDEALLLHGAGWEPVDLVCGVSVVSVPVGVWNWGQGEISSPRTAHNAGGGRVRPRSSGTSASRCTATASWVCGSRSRCARTTSMSSWSAPRYARSTPGEPNLPASPFVSDLSARDFTLLQGAGWLPVGLAFGASFVYAPADRLGTP
jgi:hypothetical protein